MPYSRATLSLWKTNAIYLHQKSKFIDTTLHPVILSLMPINLQNIQLFVSRIRVRKNILMKHFCNLSFQIKILIVSISCLLYLFFAFSHCIKMRFFFRITSEVFLFLRVVRFDINIANGNARQLNCHRLLFIVNQYSHPFNWFITLK